MENTAEKTVAQKALDFLSNIPNDEFITDRYTNGVDKCCALGHLSRQTSQDPKDYNYPNCYDEIEGFAYSVREASEKFLVHQDISTINNKQHIRPYIQPEPKDRVIHLLTDMIKNGY